MKGSDFTLGKMMDFCYYIKLYLNKLVMKEE
jgi:hypothetical protein